MIERALLCAWTMWRSSALLALVTVPVATMSAAVVIFFLALSIVIPVEGAAFQSQASYRTVVMSDSYGSGSDGISVLIVTDFPVFLANGDGTPSTVMASPELWIVPDLHRFESEVLGNNVVDSGHQGLLLDTESARLLGADPGGRVSLGFDLLDYTSPPLEVAVGGILRPYVSMADQHRRGLIVIEDGTLPDWARSLVHGDRTLTGSERRYLTFNSSVSGARTRTDVRDSFIGDLLSTGQLLPILAVVGIGLLLWLAVAWRAFSQAARRMGYSLAVLSALGGSARPLALCVVAPLAVLFGLSVVIAGAVVVDIIFPQVLHWVAEPVVVALPCVALGVVEVAVLLVGYRVILRRLSSHAVVELLGQEEG